MADPLWAKQFYRSKAWRKIRAAVIQRDGGVCRHCGRHMFEPPDVHHLVELTAENHRNPAVSLNPALLVSVHDGCHNDIHGKFTVKDKETIVSDDLEVDYARR